MGILDEAFDNIEIALKIFTKRLNPEHSKVGKAMFISGRIELLRNNLLDAVDFME